METKKQIRARILKKRDLLTPEEIEEKSERICRTILACPEFIHAETVLVYLHFKSEVRTDRLLEAAWESGKCVGVPRIEGKEMVFAKIGSRDELSPGIWSIPEPEKSCPVITNPDSRTVVIMPGVVFDFNRNRIGYGGGYYDKYFSKYPDVYKIAAAYELQITESIPFDPHDLKPDCIVTEQNYYVG